MILSGERLSLHALRQIAAGERLEISHEAIQRMEESRSLVERILELKKVVYGINTGFGKLSDVHIDDSQLAELQLNLVRSHACGFGVPLSIEESRVCVALRANVLAKGFSGARPLVATALCKLINSGLTPVIPSRGSVGASGDLAPLAHLALTLIGEGEVWHKGSRMAAADGLKLAGIEPITLQAKEGLALLNGTQAICCVGSLALVRALTLLNCATIGTALSLDALKGTDVAFDPRIHDARGQSGQIHIARQLVDLLAGSEIRESHRDQTDDKRVQDAYCLRCVPQVHGAALDQLRFAREIVETESAAATDNPLVFSESGDILSGGNFHGAPVALAFDCAAISVVQAMSILERRLDRLVNPDTNEGLPAFLAKNPGVESGLMMLHVSVAAALNEARVLAHPASIDNTPTSGGKEDHVSMGMTAALKFRDIVRLFAFAVAAEWYAASQAIHYREPLRTSPKLEVLLAHIRKNHPPFTRDQVFGPTVEQLAEQILSGDFDDVLSQLEP